MLAEMISAGCHGYDGHYEPGIKGSTPTGMNPYDRSDRVLD